jgi:hypothetical protein
MAGTINGSFRKTVATLIDDEGLSARIGADHLGHTHVSMPQDRYMARAMCTRRSLTCWDSSCLLQVTIARDARAWCASGGSRVTGRRRN